MKIIMFDERDKNKISSALGSYSGFYIYGHLLFS